jgi:hypothetical protein
MTERRDLKGRVRDRQARTGESYVTALRQVLAQRPSRIPVIELFDLSALGARLGFTCRISAFPDLVERVDPRQIFSLQLVPHFVHVNRDPLLIIMPLDGLAADPIVSALAERLGDGVEP